MLEHLMRPHPARVGAVPEDKVTVPHVAVGIWIGVIAVLVLPSPGKHQHRVTERHLIRAYGAVMSAFPLL